MKYTDQTIRMISSQISEYDAGCKLYAASAVHDTKYNDKTDIYFALVNEHGHDYHVYVKTADTEDGMRYHCDCPSSRELAGACRHTVALLKAIQAFDEHHDFYMDHMIKEMKRKILALHEPEMAAEVKKEVVNIEMYLKAGQLTNHLYSGFTLEFKIGMDKMYVLRNIPALIRARKEGTSLYFGKDFTYIPELHTFSEAFLQSLDFLDTLYDIKIDQNSLNVREARALSITSRQLYELLGYWVNQTVYLDDGITTHKVEISQDQLPHCLLLSYLKQQILLDIRPAQEIFALAEDKSILLQEKMIYLIEERQAYILNPFIEAAYQGIPSLSFSGEEKEQFIQNVIPAIEQMMTLPESIQRLYRKVPLKAKIYLDRARSTIYLKAEFTYDQLTFDPFLTSSPQPVSGRMILRSKKEENRIISIINNAGFVLNSQKKLYLKDDKSVSRFIFEYLPHLTTLAEIYYTKEFKQLTQKRSLTPFVQYHPHSNLLSIDFLLNDLDASALLKALEAYRASRHYIRLKDGQFLAIDDKRSQETLKMLDDLHVDMKQMHDGILTLSLSQAFYLNEHLSDTKDFDESFHQFIERFYHPDAHPYSLPNGLQADLRTYQKTGYQWLKTLSDYQLGGILADDMGLGKTLQTITYLLDEVQHNHKPNLVVAPSSLIFNWQDEIKRFAPSLKACVISGTQTDRSSQLSQADQYDILITSYPLLRRDSQVYSEMIFNCCILDEAQYIKNANSLNARAAKQIQAKKRFALTGTPMENALSELWSIFDFILPGYFSNYHHFHQKYEIPIRRDEDQETQQLLANQIKPFILRRMKQEVLDELPEKTETKITVEMTPRQKNVYQALLLEAKQLLDQKINQDGFEKSKLLMLNLMTRLRQVCCHPKLYLESYDGESGKLNTLLELIKEAIQSHHKILVFSQFTSMLALIKEALELNEITYSYLDGQTPVANRTELVQQFNQGETPVFLISLKAGGTGLNLTGADMVIHVDPWWNPAVEEQATDRAYRIGQQNKVQVYKLITKDTLEDAIYELQKEKKALIESVIQPGENFLNKLSESELYALFSNDQSM